jgi:hypothetical protein
VRSLWKGLTPFATHLTLKYALRMGSNSVYQNMLRDEVRKVPTKIVRSTICMQLADLCSWPPSRPVTVVGCHALIVGLKTGPLALHFFGCHVPRPCTPASPGPPASQSSLSLSHTHTLARSTQNGKLTDGRRMGAGFLAGITEALVIVTPFEVVKIRLQQQKGLSKESLKYKVSHTLSQLHHCLGSAGQRPLAAGQTAVCRCVIS